MRKLVLSLVAIAACLAATYALTSSSNSLRAMVAHPDFSAFNRWQLTHQKIYSDETELMVRFGIWLAKHHEIQVHNSKKLNYTLGHNQFSDMTTSEFKNQILCTMTPVDIKPTQRLQGMKALDSIDWVKKGALSDIKDQGGCGSCWAFSAVATLESRNAVKENLASPDTFSEQEQVDCNHNNCAGCNGGNPYFSFLYWQDRRAASDKCYSYRGVDGTCRSDCPEVGPKVTGVYYEQSEAGLKSLVSEGVVSVGIHADSIMSYEGGIFDDDCYGQIDHAVNVVGYTPQYIKLRNSWGSGWGENGYFKFPIGQNKCSVNSMVLAPAL